ncbi:hypothetical protein JHK87_055910 [Glycine soja]|nr:hypothetical protein JHK87_055910 [Glycine soja]
MIKNNLGGLGQNSREELSKPVGRKKNSIPKKCLYVVSVFITALVEVEARTTKTIEQYHRSSFTPQDEHVECETQSWYQEVSKLKAKYDSLQRTQRHLLGEDVGPLNIKELQNLEKQLEGSSAQPRQRKGSEALLVGPVGTFVRTLMFFLLYKVLPTPCGPTSSKAASGTTYALLPKYVLCGTTYVLLPKYVPVSQ